MEDLKCLLDNKDLKDIKNEFQQFVQSAKDHKNLLKKVFALLYLMEDACELLKSIEKDDFIKSFMERIDEINEEAEKLNLEYKGQLTQNNKISQLLADSSNNRIKEIQSGISTLLDEYDNIIKELIENKESDEKQKLRDKLNCKKA